jgi:D-3-phosphoglycerate dehydrogenase / 2-oxoglutarate reductase
MTRHASGTVFQDGKPRFVDIRDIQLDAEFSPHMLYVRNADKSGFIGKFGSVLGEAGVNVATFNLGRDKRGGDAICFVAVDEAISDEVLAKIHAIPQVKRARRVSF